MEYNLFMPATNTAVAAAAATLTVGETVYMHRHPTSAAAEEKMMHTSTVCGGFFSSSAALVHAMTASYSHHLDIGQVVTVGAVEHKILAVLADGRITVSPLWDTMTIITIKP